MAGRTIFVRGPADLRRHLDRFGKAVDGAMLVAANRAATWAVALLAETAPQASGTYARSFRRRQIPGEGAEVGSVAQHAIFVEIGRRPGGRPPLGPILRWMKARRIAPSGGSQGGQRGRDTKGRFTGGGGRKAKRSKALISMAARIAHRIAKRGTKGKHHVERSVPAVQQQFFVEAVKAMDAVMRSERPTIRERRRTTRRG